MGKRKHVRKIQSMEVGAVIGKTEKAENFRRSDHIPGGANGIGIDVIVDHSNFLGCFRKPLSPGAPCRLACIMREGAVEGKTQEPPCGTNVVHTTF